MVQVFQLQGACICALRGPFLTLSPNFMKDFTVTSPVYTASQKETRVLSVQYACRATGTYHVQGHWLRARWALENQLEKNAEAGVL